MDKPFTLNVIDRSGEIVTDLFDDKSAALAAAYEETRWENTVHATVTDERTGEDIFDEPGSFSG